MVSWVPQIVIPPLVALAFFRRLPRGWVMAMAPAIFLSDLDYAVPGEHRVWTHTLLWPVLCLAAAVVLWRRRAPALPFLDFATMPGGALAFLLAAYYLTAHAVMDVFTGGVVLFWPFSNLNVFIDFRLFVDTKTNTLEPQTDAGTTNGPFPVDPLYEWVSGEHTAILAFLATCALGWLFVRVWRAWRIAMSE